MPFMGRLLSVLKTGGELVLVTNERFYFEEARKFLSEQWKMRIQAALEFDCATVPYLCTQDPLRKEISRPRRNLFRAQSAQGCQPFRRVVVSSLSILLIGEFKSEKNPRDCSPSAS